MIQSRVPDPLVIFGAGGLAREIYHLASLDDREVVAFFDENPTYESIFGIPVISDLTQYAQMSFVIAVGDPELRERFWKLAADKNLLPCLPIISERAAVYRANIMRGAILCAGVVVTDNVTIGNNVLLNLNVTVGHDTIIERHSVVSPGANISGNCLLRQKCYIGTGAAIREKIEIGAQAVVGMGSTIVKPVPPKAKMVGPSVRNLAEPSKTVTLVPVNQPPKEP